MKCFSSSVGDFFSYYMPKCIIAHFLGNLCKGVGCFQPSEYKCILQGGEYHLIKVCKRICTPGGLPGVSWWRESLATGKSITSHLSRVRLSHSRPKGGPVSTPPQTPSLTWHIKLILPPKKLEEVMKGKMCEFPRNNGGSSRERKVWIQVAPLAPIVPASV